MSIVTLLIALIVIAAVFGILQAVGAPLPANVMSIIWIVVAAAVAIWAIKFLVGVVA